MKSGTPLADEYRENWAERIIGGMIACSCLCRRAREWDEEQADYLQCAGTSGRLNCRRFVRGGFAASVRQRSGRLTPFLPSMCGVHFSERL
jgi:hypothetical protein